MSSVRCVALSKVYPEGGGIREFSCEIGDGEVFAFLGPSGCGKTTTLRVIAGLEEPDSGQVFFGDRDVTGAPPERRNAAMVFQNYALFPHMSIFDNVAFGLRARKMPKAGDRAPRSRSAGPGATRRARQTPRHRAQRRPATTRRVGARPRRSPRYPAAGRTPEQPRRRTRYATRVQLAELQKRVGITAIYVTHDQEEALTLAHRIAVLKDGHCHQIGTPDEILNHPATPFVEAFLERQRKLLARG